jgi:hypothetical protein
LSSTRMTKPHTMTSRIQSPTYAAWVFWLGCQ